MIISFLMRFSTQFRLRSGCYSVEYFFYRLRCFDYIFIRYSDIRVSDFHSDYVFGWLFHVAPPEQIYIHGGLHKSSCHGYICVRKNTNLNHNLNFNHNHNNNYNYKPILPSFAAFCRSHFGKSGKCRF